MKKETKIFLTVWFVYILFISGYGGNWMADSMLRLSIAIVDDQVLFIDKYIKGNEDNSFFEGHYYSGFAPGASFLTVPFYFFSKPLFKIIPTKFLGYPDNQLKLIFLNIITTVFITSLLAAMISVLVYKFLNNFSKNEKIKLLITFIFSFSTFYFLYATTFDAKIISTFFTFFTFYLLFNMKKSKGYKSTNLFFAGFFLGFAVITEYSQVISLLLLFLYAITFLRNKKIIFLIIGVLIPLASLLAYNQIVFKDPLTTPYEHRASEHYVAEYNKGFGIPTHAWYILSFSPFRGFLFYMPVMLLLVYGFYLGFKLKKFKTELLLILVLFLSFFLYNASFKSELFYSAGCSFGPRFLLPAIPFVILALGFITSKVGKWFLLILGFISFFINLLPNLYGITHLWTYKCMEANPLKHYLPFIFKKGLTNYTFSLIGQTVYTIPICLVNLIMIISILCLIFVIWKIWNTQSK